MPSSSIEKDVAKVVKVIDRTEADARLKMTAQIGWMRHIFDGYIVGVLYLLVLVADQKVLGDRPGVERPVLLEHHIPITEVMIAFYVLMFLVFVTLYLARIERPHRHKLSRNVPSKRSDYVTYEFVQAFSEPMTLTAFYTIFYLILDRWHHTTLSLLTFSGMMSFTLAFYIVLYAIPPVLHMFGVLKREVEAGPSESEASKIESVAESAEAVLTDIEAAANFSFISNVGWLQHAFSYYMYVVIVALATVLDQRTLGLRPHVESPAFTDHHVPTTELMIGFWVLMFLVALAAYAGMIEMPLRKARTSGNAMKRAHLFTKQYCRKGLIVPITITMLFTLIYLTLDKWYHTRYSFHTLSGSVLTTFGSYMVLSLATEILCSFGVVKSKPSVGSSVAVSN